MMIKTPHGSVASLVAVILCALSPKTALAQSAPTEAPASPITAGQIVARRALLERAQAAARANDHAQALSLAQQAAAIEMTISLRMFLAQQQQALGHHTEAMEYSEQCVREALRNTTLERRDVIITECRRVSSTSQAQLVLATVTVPAGLVAQFTVRIGSRPIQPSEYNLPIAIDPGEGELVATAPGVETHTERFRGTPGSTLALIVPARFHATQPAAAQTTNNTTVAAQTPTNASNLASTGPANATATSATPATSTNANASANASGNGSESRRGPQLIPLREPSMASRIGAGPWVVLGLGAATLASAGVFFALRNAEFSACRPAGAEILCDNEQAAAQWRAGTSGSSAYTYNTVMNATLIGGGVLMAGGLTWLIINVARAPQTEQRPTASLQLHAVVPQASAQSVGIAAAGSF